MPIAEVGFDGKGVFVRFANGKVVAGGNIHGSGSPQDDDVALVLHTSGTTGKPKGASINTDQGVDYTDSEATSAVPLTHVNLATTMRNVQNTYKLSPADRTYLVMPLFHVHGKPLHSISRTTPD